MKTVKIMTFENGRSAVSGTGIYLKINKKNPVNVEEIEVDDDRYQELMDNPPKNIDKNDHWRKELLGKNKDKKDK